MGRLTTHVLDTASGKPAAGLKIELFRFGEEAPLKTIRTNADGRADGRCSRASLCARASMSCASMRAII